MKICVAINPLVSFVICAIWMLSVNGCTSKIKGMSEEAFRIKEFSEKALATEGLALLPVIVLNETIEPNPNTEAGIPAAPYTPDVNKGRESDSPQDRSNDAYQIIINSILLTKIQDRRPSLKLVTPGDALLRLNNTPMAGPFSRFTTSFTKDGFNREQLSSFGNALKCRYLFVSQAIISETKSDVSVTIVWTFGRKSLLRSVKLNGQIWDTVTGNQVWEGAGVGFSRLVAYEGAPLFESMVQKAADSLLARIFP